MQVPRSEHLRSQQTGACGHPHTCSWRLAALRSSGRHAGHHIGCNALSGRFSPDETAQVDWGTGSRDKVRLQHSGRRPATRTLLLVLLLPGCW